MQPNRYALAAAVNGAPLEPWVRALHGCNNMACVRMRLAGETGLLSVVPGSRQHGDDGSGGPRGRSRGGAPRLGRRRCGGGVVGFDAANVRCGVVGAAGVAVGRGAVAARCRRAGAPGGEPGCFQGCSRRSAATGIAGFGERVSPWWRAVAVQQPGAGVAEGKGGPANPRWLGSWPGPMAGVAGYRVCSIGNAWAVSDWLLLEAVMLRSARAALGSLAVRIGSGRKVSR